MELHGYFRSSAAYRLRIALNHKHIPYTHVGVNLVKGEHQSPEYLQINPQGLVPALKTDEGVFLTQSSAILEWLEETYPEIPMLPDTGILRAKVRSFCHTITSDIHPIQNLRILKYLVGELGVSEQAKLDWYRHWITLGFSALESQIATDSMYCFGDQITLADACLVPQMYNARRFETNLDAFPKLVAITDRLNKLQAFIDAAPENQPDAPDQIG